MILSFVLVSCGKNENFDVVSDNKENKDVSLNTENIDEEMLEKEVNEKDDTSELQSRDKQLSINEKIMNVDETFNKYTNEAHGISFHFPKKEFYVREQYPESIINIGNKLKISVIDINNSDEINDVIKKKFHESCDITNQKQVDEYNKYLTNIDIGDGKPRGETKCFYSPSIYYNSNRNKLYIYELGNWLMLCSDSENKCYDNEILSTLRFF